MLCPNLNSPEWKALVEKIGEANAWREFLAHGTIPDASRYSFVENGEQQTLFYSLRTKTTTEIKAALDPTIFKNQQEIKYGKFIQAAVLNALGDVSPGKQLTVRPSEAFEKVKAVYVDIASSLNAIADGFIQSEAEFNAVKASTEYDEIVKQFPVLYYLKTYGDLQKAVATYNKLVTDFDKYRDFVIAELAHKGIRLTTNKVEAVDRQDAADKEEDDSDEVEIANTEVGERFDKSIFETNPRNTASVRIKAMLETIKTGEYELGIPVYADPADVFADILHAGSVIALTGFETAQTKLAAFRVAIGQRKDSRPYLSDFIDKLDTMERNGEWDKINDLLSFATKAFANETLLLYRTRRQGDKVSSVSDVKVISSNRDTIEEQVSRDWLAQHMTSDFFEKSATGELRPNAEKIAQLGKIVEEGRNTKVHEEKVQKFREFFQVLGITFTDNDIAGIVPKLGSRLKKGAAFEIVFSNKGMLENIFKSYEGNKDQPFVGNYGFQDEKTSMYKLAALYYDANPGKYNITSARTADGKNKYLYILPNYAENKKREWENGQHTSVINSALALPNKDFWTDVKNGNKTFKLDYFNGIREQESGRDGKVRKGLTEKEQTVSMFLKHQENTRTGSYIIFTLSDKTTTIETKVTKEFFVNDEANEIPMGRGTDYVLENGTIVYTPTLKEKVYTSFVEPEISRILAAMANEAGVNLENFATASRLFYFLPNLNADARLEDFRKELYSGTAMRELKDKYAQLVGDIVLEFFSKSAERQLQSLIKSGVIEENNGTYTFPVFNDGFKKGSYVQKFRETGAKGKNLALLMLMDMKLNYTNAQVKTIQFLRFDPMLAFKANKSVPKGKRFEELTGVEKIKHAMSTWDEFSKRAAALIAPGSQGNWSWKWDAGQKDYASFKYNAVTAEDLELDINGITNTTTDGQEFVTMQEHIDYLMSEGKLPLDVWENIHKKIEGAKNHPARYYELNERELSFVFNPVKPVMAHDANVGPEGSGLNRVDYIKTSRFPLIPQHEAGSQRDKLRIWMEKNNIQSLNFASGKKLGRPAKSVKVFDENGNFVEPNRDDLALAVQELSRDGLRNQQEIPHQKSHITTVTQMNRTLFDGLLDTEFTIAGLPLTGYQGKALKESVRSRLFELNARKLRERMGDLSQTHEGLYELLKDVILNDTTGSYGENDLRSLQLGPDGKFLIPLEFQFKSRKFQGLINSLVNKNVMLKVDGASFIQVSGVGAKYNFSQLSEGVKSGIVWTDRYAKTFSKDGVASLQYIKKEGQKVSPAQVLVSQYLRDKDDNLIDLSQYIKEENGIKILDTSRFTEEMFQLVGTRIPNQSHPSMLPIEVVGFLPSYMENTIVVPDGITGQMGADFDVDKLYAYLSKMVPQYKDAQKIDSLLRDIEDNYTLLEKEYDDLRFLKEEKKKLRALNKERLSSLKERRREIREELEKSMKGEKKAALHEELQSINEELESIFESLAGIYSEVDLSQTAVGDIKSRIKEAKRAIRELQKEENVERYTPVSYELNSPEDIESFSKEQLEQLYRDIHWAVLTHPDAYDKITKSVDMPEVKKKIDRRAKLLAKYGIVKESDLVLPLDYQTSIDRFNDNRSGKDGVAVFANFISAQADLQDKPLRLGYFDKQNGEAVEDPLLIRLKKDGAPVELLYLGRTGESTSFIGENRNISENLNMMFTESVDNAKNQNLREFNWDKKAMSPVGSMVMLTSKDGQAAPIEFAMDITSQPVIKQLFELVDQKQDSFGKFDTDAFGNAVKDLEETIAKGVQNYLPAGQLAAAYLSDEKRDDVLDPDTLEDMWLVGEARTNPDVLKKIAEDLGYPSTEALLLKYYTVQYDALQFFARIDGIGRELMTILGGTYVYTKGIGPDAFNTKQKLNQLNKLSSSTVFLDIENIAGDVEKSDNGMISLNPRGEVGASLEHSLIEAQHIYSQIFPITSGKELEKLVDMLLSGVGANKDQLGKERYINAYSDVFNAVKAYMYTAPELGLFDNVRETRSRLINGDTSLGKRITDLKTDPVFSKNGFLKNIEVKKQYDGDAYTIQFKAPFGTDIDEKAVLSGFYELALSDREEIRELARDLALYPFASGDAGNIGRFVPVDYYMADEDFNRAIRQMAQIYATHMMSGANALTVLDQIVQNNVDSYTKKFSFSTVRSTTGTRDSVFKTALKPLIAGADDLSKVSRFTIKVGDIKKVGDKAEAIASAFQVPLTKEEMEDAEKRGIAISDRNAFKYPPYILLTDSFLDELDMGGDRTVKYLYKRITPAVTEDGAAQYERIEVLGYGSIKEYDYNNPQLTSVIKDNNVSVDEAPEVQPEKQELPPVTGPVKANIPQNLVSGETAFGTLQYAKPEVIAALGEKPHSIDMIKAGFRTRTTRSADEMKKYDIKVGDIIKHFGKSADGTTKEVLARVTAIHPKGTPDFTGTWDKEGWTPEGVAAIERYKDGAAAIEFEVIGGTSTPAATPADYVNHSGGAEGSDIEWDRIGQSFGVVNHNHYWMNKKTPHGNKEITPEDLTEGQQKVTVAARQMGRIEQTHQVRDERLIRNWSQVKYADAVFAIVEGFYEPGDKMNYEKTALVKQGKGGTGYAIQMAINEGKPVFVFDQSTKTWYTDSQFGFIPLSEAPVLTKNFAGIGTRKINDAGRQAIREVYTKTFGAPANNGSSVKEEKTDGRKTYEGIIETLAPNQVFVFGSNPEGRHGKGAAKLAADKFGAERGNGRGLMGQSYALVTKSLKAGFTEPSTGITYDKEGERSVSGAQIISNIHELYQTALAHPEKEFLVAYSAEAQNLNGYTPQEMARMFSAFPIPENVVFEKGFNALLREPAQQLAKVDDLNILGTRLFTDKYGFDEKTQKWTPMGGTVIDYQKGKDGYGGTAIHLKVILDNGKTSEQIMHYGSFWTKFPFQVDARLKAGFDKYHQELFPAIIKPEQPEETGTDAREITVDSGTFLVEGDFTEESGYQIWYKKADGSKGALLRDQRIINKVIVTDQMAQFPERVITLEGVEGSPKYFVNMDNEVISLQENSFGKLISAKSVREKVLSQLSGKEEVGEGQAEEKGDQPLMRGGKIVKVPEGSSPSNNVIFEDEKHVYLMNDGQQEAFDYIKGTVERLLKERKPVTPEQLGDTVSFSDPLTQKFNGLIPKAMWDNMIGLAGRGGVGKTTVIKAIIAAIEGANKYNRPSVMYLAPTHTAATVLQESLGLDSEKANDGTVNTISSHLRRNVPVGDNLLLASEGDYENSCKYKPSFGSPDIIIVDESSMVGAQDIKDMITRLKTDLTEKKYRSAFIHRMPIFIFMGDYRQLGPINEQQNKYVNKGVISATLLLDKAKTKELTQVMRSDDKLLHQVYDSIGNEIVDNIQRTQSGQQPRELSFSQYDRLTSQSTENILVVNNVDGVVDDYTTYLAENNNPYGMFWVHYNNVQNPKTKNLAEKIRASYFQKIGLPIEVTNYRTFSKGDYIEFTGSLEMDSDKVKYTPLDEKMKKLFESKKMFHFGDGLYQVPGGVIKPRARFKVLDITASKKPLTDYLPQFVQRYVDSSIQVDVEDVLLYNRQNRIRALTKVLGITVNYGKYNDRNKMQEGIEIREKATNKLLAKFDVHYSNYKGLKSFLDKLNDKGTMPFVPSYIGSSHTAQGNSIKNVIVGDYNVKEARNNSEINQDDIFSSMYTSLTRTSGTLTIIKPSSAPIIQNQEVFQGAITDDRKNLKPVSSQKPLGAAPVIPVLDIQTPPPAVAQEEFDILSMILQSQNEDAETLLTQELFGGQNEVTDFKGFLNKLYKSATPLNKQILQMIGKAGAITPVRFVLDYKAEHPGIYDNIAKTITINPKLAIGSGFADMKEAENRLHEVIMHELLHHVTADLLLAKPETLSPEQRKWVLALNNLFNEVQGKILRDPNHAEKLRNAIEQSKKENGYLSKGDKSQYYGLTNVHDFVAMLMTDAGFQSFMNNVEYSGEKSILDRFLDILTSLLKALGVEVKDNSVLKEGVKAITGLITSRTEGQVQKSITVKEDLLKENITAIIDTLNIKTTC